MCVIYICNIWVCIYTGKVVCDAFDLFASESLISTHQAQYVETTLELRCFNPDVAQTKLNVEKMTLIQRMF